jgi:hypothetical protein
MPVVSGWLFVPSVAESRSGQKKIKWQKAAFALRTSACALGKRNALFPQLRRFNPDGWGKLPAT